MISFPLNAAVAHLMLLVTGTVVWQGESKRMASTSPFWWDQSLQRITRAVNSSLRMWEKLQKAISPWGSQLHLFPKSDSATL